MSSSKGCWGFGESWLVHCLCPHNKEVSWTSIFFTKLIHFHLNRDDLFKHFLIQPAVKGCSEEINWRQTLSCAYHAKSRRVYWSSSTASVLMWHNSHAVLQLQAAWLCCWAEGMIKHSRPAILKLLTMENPRLLASDGLNMMSRVCRVNVLAPISHDLTAYLSLSEFWMSKDTWANI